MTRIIVVGIPRSGTTWVATMLAQAKSTTLLSEPDNHNKVPFAVRAKRKVACAVALVKEKGSNITDADLDTLRDVCRCGTYQRIGGAIKAGAANM